MNKHRFSKERSIKSSKRKSFKVSKRKSIISISKKMILKKVDEKVTETPIKVIYVQMILASLLSLTVGILFVKIATQAVDQTLQDIEPPKNQIFKGEFANPMVPNLVIVYDEGTVMKVTFNKNFQITNMQKLLKIPKSNSYFAYSFKGLLYLAYDKPTRKMTKYHPALSKSGFRLVENSGMDLDEWNKLDNADKLENWDDWDQLYFSDGVVKNGVQCGAKFWILGKLPQQTPLPHPCYLGCGIETATLHHSYIWYQKRQVWKKGPNIQPQLLFRFGAFCSCAINQTSVMLMGLEKNNGLNTLSVFVYEFDSDSWTNYPNLNMLNDILFGIERACTANIVHDKSGKK